MEVILDNKTVKIQLEDRISSSNADTFEKDIMKIINDNKDCIIVLDAGKLQYISSAGLRVLLKIKKGQVPFSIINVSSEVYEIFETTGFAEMLDVKKALREISVEGLKVIGKGQTGTVYQFDDDRIVKVFTSESGESVIQREKDHAKNSFMAGIPTAISYETVKAGDCYGLIYEMLDAKDLISLMKENPDKLYDYVKEFALFFKKHHEVEVDVTKFINNKTSLVKYMDKLAGYTCSPEEVEKIKAVINNIPERNTFVHGDAHMGNVMVRDGEMLFIDMVNVGYGHPIFDMMSLYMFFNITVNDPEQKAKNDIIKDYTYEQCQQMWKVFISTYLGTDDDNLIKEVEEQIRVFVCARIQVVALAHPDMFSKESLNEMKQIVIDAYDAGLKPICF